MVELRGIESSETRLASFQAARIRGSISDVTTHDRIKVHMAMEILVVVAVASEPVSARKLPVSREKSPILGIRDREKPRKPGDCAGNSLRSEQGTRRKEQGKLTTQQGMRCA